MRSYSTPTASQQLAARIAGFTLLLLIFSGLLSNFAFNAPLLVESDAAATLHNLQVLIKTLHSFEHSGSYIGLMFFCLGAGVHSFLLFQSRYIPRVLSGLYLFACAEMLVCFFVVLMFPRQMPSIGFVWLIPDLIAEISVATWLAFRGAAISSPARETNTA
jgi:hypothetical protein